MEKFLGKSVGAVTGSLAVVGFLYIGFKILSFIRVILSLFILPGVDVSMPLQQESLFWG